MRLRVLRQISIIAYLKTFEDSLLPGVQTFKALLWRRRLYYLIMPFCLLLDKSLGLKATTKRHFCTFSSRNIPRSHVTRTIFEYIIFYLRLTAFWARISVGCVRSVRELEYISFDIALVQILMVKASKYLIQIFTLRNLLKTLFNHFRLLTATTNICPVLYCRKNFVI